MESQNFVGVNVQGVALKRISYNLLPAETVDRLRADTALLKLTS
jgi:hypothetical protein